MDDPALLDLGPRLLARKRSTCAHPSIEIDDELPSLTCAECGAEIDPYAHLRELADSEHAWYAHLDELRTKYRDEHTRLSAKIRHLVDEVNALVAKKNQLWNERAPDGRLLGQVMRRPRRRAATTTTRPTGAGEE